MKKILLTFLAMFMFISFVSAQNFTVNPYDTIILPQVTSNVSLDITGLQRTYLFCTWAIDGLGETAAQMSTDVCPENETEYTFDGDVTQVVTIQAFGITWNEAINDWQFDAGSPYVSGFLENNFDMVDPPEPSPALFGNILDIIIGALQGLLCDLFPFFGFCG